MSEEGLSGLDRLTSAVYIVALVDPTHVFALVESEWGTKVHMRVGSGRVRHLK